jgi:hypothetical protein
MKNLYNLWFVSILITSSLYSQVTVEVNTPVLDLDFFPNKSLAQGQKYK